MNEISNQMSSPHIYSSNSPASSVPIKNNSSQSCTQSSIGGSIGNAADVLNISSLMNTQTLPGTIQTSIEATIQQIVQLLLPIIQTLTMIVQQIVGSIFSAAPLSTESVPSQGSSLTPDASAAGTTAAQSNSGTSQGAPVTQKKEDTNETGDSQSPKKSSESNFFLFKPYSDKDKNVAILLPADMNRKSAGVDILGPNGKVLGTGRYSGIDNASGREVFRFGMQGSDLPESATVRVRFQDGTEKNVKIHDTRSELKRRIAD